MEERWRLRFGSGPLKPQGKVAWNLVATTCWVAGTFLAQVLVARLFGPSVSGQLNYWLWVTAFIGIVSGMGVPETYLRYRALNINKPIIDSWGRRHFSFTFVIGLLALLLFFTQEEKLNWPVLLLVILLFITGRLRTLGKATLIGGEQFRRIAALSLTGSLIQVLAIGAALVTSVDPLSIALIAFVLANGIVGLGSHDLLLSKETTTGASALDGQLRSYSIIVWGGTLASLLLMERTEVLFLERFHGFDDVGAYSVGVLIPNVVNLAIATVGISMLPSLSSNSRVEIYRVFNRDCIDLTRVLIGATSVLAIILVGTAPWITLIFFGKGFYDTDWVISLLAISTIFNAASALATAAFYGEYRPSVVLLLSLSAAILVLGLDILLIPQWGVIGAAAGKAGAQVAMAIVGILVLNAKAGSICLGRPVVTDLAIASALTVAIIVIRQGLGDGIWACMGAVVLGVALQAMYLWHYSKEAFYRVLGLGRGMVLRDE